MYVLIESEDTITDDEHLMLSFDAVQCNLKVQFIAHF